MHKLCLTLGEHWIFQQVIVMCLVDFASTLDSVYRDSLWRIVAVDGTLNFKGQQNAQRVHQDDALWFALALYKNLHSSLPCSLTLSTGFLVKSCTNYRGVQTGIIVHVFDWPMTTISGSRATNAGRYKIFLKQLTTTPPRLACALTPRWCQRSSMLSFLG